MFIHQRISGSYTVYYNFLSVLHLYTLIGLIYISYTLFFRQGYLNASRSFRPNDLDVDVTGKSFMITGANSGIGKCTALAIAKKG